MQIHIYNLDTTQTKTHTLYDLWDHSGKEGGAADRTLERPGWTDQRQLSTNPISPARQIVFQKSQIVLDSVQAPGDATLSEITEKLPWTSSLLCSHNSSETNEA